MTTEGFSIDLTLEEKSLLDKIELDALSLRGHEHAQRNGRLVIELIKSLVARRGIPEHRRRYFTDPDYYLGSRGRSRQQGFERNGRRGDDILSHPHFLAYLRYFLHGPNLPASVIGKFRQAVLDCGDVTSGDIDPLSKVARQLVRTYRLVPKKAADEFYKLSLEFDIDPDTAAFFHNAVRQVRFA